MLATAATGGVAGHPLWHLAIVVAAPGAIIVGFRWYDRLRYGPPASESVEKTRSPVAHPWLIPLAAASVAAAVIHAGVCPSHFREDAFFGAFFLVLCLAQLLWSGWILRSATPTVLLIGVIGNLAVVSLWLYTRTVGLPSGSDGGAAESFGALDVVASSLEVFVILLAAHLRRRMLTPTARRTLVSPGH